MLFEKHFTDDVTRQGPDHCASLEPEQLRDYIERTRSEQPASMSEIGEEIFAGMWGEIHKRVLDCERDVREVSRQSVVTARAIVPGETITREMLTIKRPGTGILAYRLDEIVGKVAKRAIESDVPVVEEDLA